MLKVGIAGMGFMGWIHWLAYQQNDGVEIVAIATPEEDRRAGDWTSIKGNFGPPGEQVDLTGIKTYETLDAMLADDSLGLDYVDICLPPSMHPDAIVSVANAGKHVFCEKPLALSLAECDRAVAACQSNNVLMMVGQVLPFLTEFQFAYQAINSGKYGKLLGGNFKRVISDPQWLKHFYDPKIIGGPLFDLHVHDAHFIRLLFGMPLGVFSSGRTRGGVVDYCNSIFKFEDESLVVSAVTGVINQQGRPFTHAFEIHLEKATIHLDFAAFADEAELMPVKVCLEDGTVERPELGDGDMVAGFCREIAEVVDCLSANKNSSILGGGLARDAIEICHLQAKSVASGGYVASGE